MTDQAKKIRLLICDDQAIVCEGLRAMLTPVPQIEVVGVANNGVQAIDLTRRLQPDLILMDLKMPRMNGIPAMPSLPTIPTSSVRPLSTDVSNEIRQLIGK